MSSFLWFLFGGMIGTIAGFLAAAIIGSGQIDALEREIWRLKVDAYEREKKGLSNELY